MNITSTLYTTEASESRKRSESEKAVPDATPEIFASLIKEDATLEDSK